MGHKTSKVPIVDIPCRDSSKVKRRSRTITTTTTTTVKRSFGTSDTNDPRFKDYDVAQSEILPPKSSIPSSKMIIPSEPSKPSHVRMNAQPVSARYQDGDLDDLADQLLDQLGLDQDGDAPDLDNERHTAISTPIVVKAPAREHPQSFVGAGSSSQARNELVGKVSTKKADTPKNQPTSLSPVSYTSISKEEVNSSSKAKANPPHKPNKDVQFPAAVFSSYPTKNLSSLSPADHSVLAKEEISRSSESKQPPSSKPKKDINNSAMGSCSSSTNTSSSMSQTKSDDSIGSGSSRTSFSTNRQVPGSLSNDDYVAHPSRDIIYAHIIDLTDQKSSPQVGQAANEPKAFKLLRRMKNFTNLRLATARPVIKVDRSEDPLGVFLQPPPGSTHFELQLTLCGLLRKNTASPYELYHFFLENGFYKYSSSPPTYETWVADYTNAIKTKNPFYSEGLRLGTTGEMDFLRDLFHQWCEAWHDWRLGRPVPALK